MKVSNVLLLICKCVLLYSVGCVFASSALSADITLAWDKPTGDAVGYYIYYGKPGDDFKSAPKVTINDSNQTQYRIQGLEEGELYGFTAKSFDADGNESSFSEELYHNVPASSDETGTDGESADDTGGTGGNVPVEGEEGNVSPGEESGAGVALLTNNFYAVRLFDNVGIGTGLLEIVFDGSGGLTHTDLDMSIQAAGISLGGTYSVDAEGGLDVEGIDKGAVSRDGNCFVAGRMADTEDPSMVFGIKQSEGLTAADFSGMYKVYMFASDPDSEASGNQVKTVVGSIDADGNGQFTGADGTFSADYTVDPGTGHLAISPSRTYSEMQGALSSDGTVFIAVDTDASSDNTLLYMIGIKEAVEFSTDDLSGSYFMNKFEYNDELDSPFCSFSELSASVDGEYTVEEKDNSCDCPAESEIGTISTGENGSFEIVSSETSTASAGGLSPSGDLFTLVKEDSLSIGIKKVTSVSDSPETDEGGSSGGGGGGGCFIDSIFN